MGSVKRINVNAKGKVLGLIHAPFGDHVNPGVQFDGAFFGHDPKRSLDAAIGEKYDRSVYDDKVAHAPTIVCTPLCGP